MATPAIAPPRATVTDLEACILANRPRLVNHALRILHNREDAEDAVQLGCLRAFRGLDHFDHRSPLNVWVYCIVTNTCLDLIRRGKSRRVKFHVSLNDVTLFHQDNLEALVYSREVAEVIASLQERHQKVLYDVVNGEYAEPHDGGSFRECGDSTIRTRYRRAKALLKVKLVERGFYGT